MSGGEALYVHNISSSWTWSGHILAGPQCQCGYGGK